MKRVKVVLTMTKTSNHLAVVLTLVLGRKKKAQHISKPNKDGLRYLSGRFPSIQFTFLHNYRKVKSLIWHSVNALSHNRNIKISLSWKKLYPGMATEVTRMTWILINSTEVVLCFANVVVQVYFFKQKEDLPKFPYAATPWCVKQYVKQFVLLTHCEQLDHFDCSIFIFEKYLIQVDHKSVRCQLND